MASLGGLTNFGCQGLTHAPKIYFIPRQTKSARRTLSFWNTEKQAGKSRLYDSMASPDNKSFLAGGINSWSPWSSRTATPKPPQAQHNEAETQEHTVQAKRGGDHKVSSLQRLSMKNYPQDCPPLAVRWFHAVDVSASMIFQHGTSSKPYVDTEKKA